ncbi:GNAT family N-acetyltransferase [Aquitalea sp. LB_tupeE]|nr:GNAT family N-acetyltransferase [Aquitalea sp. LB_tupeE]
MQLRELTPADASLVLTLLNDPDFIHYVADRGIRTLDAASDYLLRGPLLSYAEHGIGLWCVERREDGQPVGMCGLIRRAGLADVDVGYVILPARRGLSYASEAATACVQYGLHSLHLPRVVAYINPDNAASARVLCKAGLHACGHITLPETTTPVLLFTSETPTSTIASS